MLRAVRLNATTYPLEPGEEQQLAEAGATLLAIEGKQADEILSSARHCDALLVVSSRLPAAVVEQLEQCRVIARLGAGTDNIDIAAATRCGIVVSNVPDFCLNEQAEHTFALLLAWARRLMYMTSAMRKGEWTARSHPQVHRLAGQTLGLLGIGRSAQAVARRAAAFEMRVLAWTRNPDTHRAMADALGIELRPLDDVLRQSDYVSIHLPLAADTRQLLDRRRLALLQPHAVLINTARGAIIDEDALVDVLRRRAIAGAGLDVFAGIDVFAQPGPPPQHPLFEMDNVLLTPHCAGSSVESSRDSKMRGAYNAACVLRGVWPPYLVNPEVQPRLPLRRLT